MLGLGGLPLVSQEAVYLLKSNAYLLLAAVVGATPLPREAARKCARMFPRLAGVLEPAAMLALLLVCTEFLVDGSYNPFLYFRF